MIAREFFCALLCGGAVECCGGCGVTWQQNIHILPPKRGGNDHAKKNVPKNATKRGGNLSQQQNILISPPKCGGNHRAKKNVPKNATKRGGNLSQQQNILTLPPKRGGNHRAKKNVLKTATKRGGTISAEGKCPGNRHKTGRNCSQGATKKPPEQFRGPDVRML